MSDTKTNHQNHQWVLFIATMLILLGIYGSLRTVINFFAFDRYPQEGVYPNIPIFSSSSYAPYSSREEDCTAYPAIYYDKDQNVRPGTPEEKTQERVQQQNCLSQVREARERAKINDISQSALFLFLGAGVIAFRRIFK